MGTFLLFAMYTCDLTARMTTGPKELPIRSFEDILRSDYRVFTVEGGATVETLANSKPGTAMHKVYYETMVGKFDR